MLLNLHIQNLAVIRDADVTFSPGFTALTGETGAGKSVLMGGLSLLAGGRADKELVRAGEAKGEVRAVFTAPQGELAAYLQEQGLWEEENVCLSRSLSADGRSVSRINGKAVSLSMLKKVSEGLFVIHGQNATQELSATEGERELLDAACGVAALFPEYRQDYEELCRIRNEIRKRTFDEKEKARTLEMLHYQLAEIKEVRPKPGEEDTLLDQKQKLKHGERIQKQTAFAYRALRGAEKGNALYILDRAAVALRQLTDVLPQAAGVAEKLDEAMALAEEAADQVETMQEEVEGNPEALLDQVESRLAAIDRLKRKYGSTVEEILRFEAEAKERLSLYEGADEEIALLKETGRAVRRRVAEKAQAIHDKRTEAAAALSGKVTEMLHYLDMPKAVFCMDVLPRPQGEAQYDAYGGDDILFRIAANPGEEPLPIEKAASGGELARIMLAIRSQLCEQNGIDTVVYDEVDAGVSGKTARKIGYLMQKSAAEGQILCVTHSAQIASLATEHLLVYKTERNGRAESFVRSLAWDERVEELSRILGGIHVTEAQRMAATDMLSGKE